MRYLMPTTERHARRILGRSLQAKLTRGRTIDIKCQIY